MHTVRMFENITLKTLCFETYIRYAQRNICMPPAICDVISSIGIGIRAAAADSVGYRVPAWYRSNPTGNSINQLL